MKTIARASKPLKAFQVGSDYSETATIIFAKTNAQARRLGSGGEWDGWECRRAPWADRYSPGPVPAQDAVDHGWWFECLGCGRRISDLGYDDEGNDFECKDVVGTLDGGVFCCPACEKEYLEDEARKEAFGQSIIEIIKDRIMSRYGAVAFSDKLIPFYVREHDGTLIAHEVRVNFDFPGQKHGPATAEIREEHSKIGPSNIGILVCNGDLEAFKAWAACRVEEDK